MKIIQNLSILGEITQEHTGFAWRKSSVLLKNTYELTIDE